jgi:hypothetical protein
VDRALSALWRRLCKPRYRRWFLSHPAIWCLEEHHVGAALPLSLHLGLACGLHLLWMDAACPSTSGLIHVVYCSLLHILHMCYILYVVRTIYKYMYLRYIIYYIYVYIISMCIYSRYIFACCLFCSRNAADTWRARCLYIYVYMSVYVDVWALAFVSLRGFRARVLSSAVLPATQRD